MAPAAAGGGASHIIRNLRVAHLKRKAETELQQGNYGHAAEQYSEAIALLLQLPPATTAAQPLLPAPAPHPRSPSPASAPASPAASAAKHPVAPAPAPRPLTTPTALVVTSTTTADPAAQRPAVPAADVPELRALLSNRSLAQLKAGRAAAAAEDAAAVVALAPGWHKGHWRLGKALAALGRWSEALDCFALAWACCEPGGAEQAECKQQLVAAVQKLTRQQLADRLLAAVASPTTDTAAHTAGARQRQELLLLPPAAASTACNSTQQLLPAPACGGSAVPPAAPVASALAAATAVGAESNTAAAAAGLLAQHHPEELREAMFQLVKASQQQQQQQGAGAKQQQLSCMQALLLKWLLLNNSVPSNCSNAVDGANSDASSTSGSSSGSTSGGSRQRGAAHLHSSILPVVLGLELQLLLAQLAVKVKSWGTAQQVAGALQERLGTLALPDEGVLLQLLVDCHVVLGEAFWADGPPSSSSTSSTSSTSSSRQTAAAGGSERFCRPYQAASACLTALELLPAAAGPPPAGSSGSSRSGDGRSSRSGDSRSSRSGDGRSSSSSSSSSTSKARLSFLQLLLRSGGVLAAAGSAAADRVSAAAAAGHLRRDVQARLDAALEQLDDFEQAAVWAATAAARSGGSSSRGSSGTSSSSSAESRAATAASNAPPRSQQAAGWELACMQLGQVQDGRGHQPLPQAAAASPCMLLTVTIAAKQPQDACNTTSNTTSSTTSSTSSTAVAAGSSGSRGLSGPARVALLRSLARAAGVGQLAVGLGQMKLAQQVTNLAHPPAAPSADAVPAAQGSEVLDGGWHCRLEALTFKVQFGADARAATAFAQLCSSLPALLSACPELAPALVGHSNTGEGPVLGPGPAAGTLPAEHTPTAKGQGGVAVGCDVGACAGDSAASGAADQGSSSLAAAAAAAAAQQAACLQLFQVAAVSLTDVSPTGARATQGNGATARPQPALSALVQAAAAGGEAAAAGGEAAAAAGGEAAAGPAGALAGSVATEAAAAADAAEQGVLVVGPASTLAAAERQTCSAVTNIMRDSSSSSSSGSCDLATLQDTSLAVADPSNGTLAAPAAAADASLATAAAASAVIPLPYAHYQLVCEDGRPVERPDKHPFALSRVLYDARELPDASAQVWFQHPGGAYRWRQTAGTVLLQLHALPADITHAKQLAVTIEPYCLRVTRRRCGSTVGGQGRHRCLALPGGGRPLAPSTQTGAGYHDSCSQSSSSNQVDVREQQQQQQQQQQEEEGQELLLFEAELFRGIVPEDCIWEFVHGENSTRGPWEPNSSGSSSIGHGSSSSSRKGGTAGVASGVAGDAAAVAGVRSRLPGAAAAAAVVEGSVGHGSCYILFELEKMNLELYERPHQHSASWWPRLFADDAADVAWDDGPKDYTDLPPAIAATAAAQAAREEEQQRRQEERREASRKLEALVVRHKEYRWERLRQLKAAAWKAAGVEGSSG